MPAGITPAEITPEHPNLPRRGALGVMFLAIALSGSLGGLIGYSLVATTCPDTPTRAEQLLEQIRGFQAHVPSCALKELGGALVGTVLAAIGAATIAILVMRAQSEWRPRAPPALTIREVERVQASPMRRNASANGTPAARPASIAVSRRKSRNQSPVSTSWLA